MSAKQPNRKPAGKRKESDASAQEGRERKRAAKRKGLKAGSRQQVEQAGKKSGTKQARIRASVPASQLFLSWKRRAASRSRPSRSKRRSW